jgi:hypothetical protein
MHWTHADNPAPVLARWLDRRLAETDSPSHPTAQGELYGITLIDADLLDSEHCIGARSSLILAGDLDDLLARGECGEAMGFDALALVRMVWLPTPDRPSRPAFAPHRFTGRRRARAVAVVGDQGTGCVVRYEDDPGCVIAVNGPGVAGLVVPLVSLWTRSTYGRA